MTVACRRVLDVVSGRPAWPVARGPWPRLCPRRNAARGPRRETERKSQRERRFARLEGLTRPRRARKREKKSGGGREERILSLVLCLASSSKLLQRAPTPSSFSCHLPSFSLCLFLLRFSLAPPRALVRAHARTLVREGSRESRSFSRRLVP